MEIEELGYLKEIRQRLGKNASDTSLDKEIIKLKPFKRVRLIVGWFLGAESWADTFKDYCESQGIYLTTNADDPDIII